MAVTDYAAIVEALVPHGLIARGGFHTVPYDLLQGQTVVLVGHAGPAMWAAFAAARREEPHPLDAWSRRVIGGVAAGLGASALYPFDGPPYQPFQQWAMRADAVHPSPSGIAIHVDYGLWHGWRGALLFAERLDLPPRDDRPNPCETCTEKPCLAACPVEAFGPVFDMAACRAHVRGAGADCRGFGCGARRACPVGQAYRYQSAQAAFHMGNYIR